MNHGDLTGGTVFRLLSTLCEAGFAEQNLENRKYRPGPQVLELANTIRSRTSLIDVAHAELETLMNQSAETVNLGVLRGDNVAMSTGSTSSGQRAENPVRGSDQQSDHAGGAIGAARHPAGRLRAQRAGRHPCSHRRSQYFSRAALARCQCGPGRRMRIAGPLGA